MFGRLLLSGVFLAVVQGRSVAAIVAGDLQMLGFISNSDSFAFVNWVDVEAGATIFFTDSGFFDDGTLRDAEDNLSWTAASNLAAGTVVVITSLQGQGISFADTGATTGQIEFNQSGDQIFAGTTAFSNFSNLTKPGATYNGQLLAGLDFSGNNTTWDSDATSTLTSALPIMLSDDLLNIAVRGTTARRQYAGPRIGFTADEFKALVDNPANWTASDIDLLDSLILRSPYRNRACQSF